MKELQTNPIRSISKHKCVAACTCSISSGVMVLFLGAHLCSFYHFKDILLSVNKGFSTITCPGFISASSPWQKHTHRTGRVFVSCHAELKSISRWPVRTERTPVTVIAKVILMSNSMKSWRTPPSTITLSVISKYNNHSTLHKLYQLSTNISSSGRGFVPSRTPSY